MIKEAIERVFEELYPEGIYIDVKMREDSYRKVKAWMEDNIPDLKQNHKQHCTLIYSKGDYDLDITPLSYTANTTFKAFELFGPDQNILVASINAPSLTERNLELVEKYGFTSDFADYKPHFTLAYDCIIDPTTLRPIDFPIYFENETVAQLNTDWKSDN